MMHHPIATPDKFSKIQFNDEWNSSTTRKVKYVLTPK